jgi:dCTP diphosphatase
MQYPELQKVLQKLQQFNQERDWSKFHNPKNLAISVSLEANELMEIFQWLDPEQSIQALEIKRPELEEEIADVGIYLLLLADKAGVNLVDAMERKIEKNNKKHPKNKEYDYLSSN